MTEVTGVQTPEITTQRQTTLTTATGLNQTTSAGIYQGTVIASGVFAVECIVIIGLIVGIVILLCWQYHRRTHKPDLDASTADLVGEPDLVMDTLGRSNLALDVEEGGGEEDTPRFDVSRLRKPTQAITDTEFLVQDESPDILSNVKVNQENTDNIRKDRVQTSGTTNPAEFINGLVDDTNEDPDSPPYDIPVIFAEEASPMDYYQDTLSSISDMSNLSQDLEFDYLNDWGPKFGMLSDLYSDDVEDW